MGITYKNMVVSEVKQDSQAAALGVQVGWGILAVNGRCGISHSHLRELLHLAIRQDYVVNFNTAAPERTISFKTGLMGIIYKNMVVTEVRQVSQAAAMGVQVGWGI